MEGGQSAIKVATKEGIGGQDPLGGLDPSQCPNAGKTERSLRSYPSRYPTRRCGPVTGKSWPFSRAWRGAPPRDTRGNLVGARDEVEAERMAGLVSAHPHRLPDGHDASAPCKHFIVSAAFRDQFGTISEREMFEALPRYCRNARGGPLGEDEVVLRNVNGAAHIFWFETFFNQHEALTLAYWVREESVVVAVP
jgi:hypothetical protein